MQINKNETIINLLFLSDFLEDGDVDDSDSGDSDVDDVLAAFKLI